MEKKTKKIYSSSFWSSIDSGGSGHLQKWRFKIDQISGHITNDQDGLQWQISFGADKMSALLNEDSPFPSTIVRLKDRIRRCPFHATLTVPKKGWTVVKLSGNYIKFLKYSTNTNWYHHTQLVEGYHISPWRISTGVTFVDHFFNKK